MKDILAVVSPGKPKQLGRKKFKEKNGHQRENENEDNLHNENEKKQKIKKIKIRLTDPAVPDSYVCEFFDSSLEQDEEAEEAETGEKKKGRKNECGESGMSKPKDYFDVLMSAELRKSHVVNTAAQNEQIPEETKLLREIDSADVKLERKLVREKNKGKLVELVNRKNGVNSYCSSTSDDESLFQVQTKLRFIPTKAKAKSGTNAADKAKNKENAVVTSLCGVDEVMTKKKNSNILNYFTREGSRGGAASAVGSDEGRTLTEIEVIEERRVESRETSRAVKLAPVFQKRTVKTVDPSVRKARLDFLQNGIPENVRKMSESWKNAEGKYAGVAFPVISHVQQRDEDPDWVAEPVDLPCLREPDDDSDYGVAEARKPFRYHIPKDVTGTSQGGNPPKANGLDNLKTRYRDVNIESMYNSLKEKKEKFLRGVEEASERAALSGNESVENIEEFEDGPNTLWTEIYKPRSGEIIGNRHAVARLSTWLKSWMEYNNEVKKSGMRAAGRRTMSGGDSDSNDDDDFVSSDDDCFGIRSPENVCLLSGPISSGKTALVYTLASELDYNVLEVNASSKRTGKKLLLDLQEATKSHQVRNGLGAPTGAESATQQKTKRKKKRRKKGGDESGPAMKTQSKSKMSLILIEDADIFFEGHDEGFVSAILTLVQSSKRPFIFLSNDPSYGYLERLKSQQALVLQMHRPNLRSSCAVLDVISTLEGVALERETLESLVRSNDHDLRKSILELQFWTQSGRTLVLGDRFALGRLWWGFNRFLYERDNVHHLKLNYRKRKRSSELWDSSSEDGEEVTAATSSSERSSLSSSSSSSSKSTKKVKLAGGAMARRLRTPPPGRSDPAALRAYALILDAASEAELHRPSWDAEPVPADERRRPKDGLSLSERVDSVNWKMAELSDSIARELVRVSVNVFAGLRPTGSQFEMADPSSEEIRWRNMHQGARKDLLKLVPASGGNTRRSVHLDYLPVIRNMCRTERSRFSGNTKRRNRFCHYFRGLGIDPREESLDISCDALR